MAYIPGIAVGFGEYEELIHSVSDLSDKYNKRMRVVFLNGYELSILGETKGFGIVASACCHTYEIALWNPDGNLVEDFFDGDSILGYADAYEIGSFAEKICEL